jgi:hypothetical protein
MGTRIRRIQQIYTDFERNYIKNGVKSRIILRGSLFIFPLFVSLFWTSQKLDFDSSQR